jgi:rSAM/selenodomain-associated transferase 2
VEELLPESGNPSTSIIIPVLNESLELRETLKQLSLSLRGNTDVEIIVSDGSSDDDSLEIARQYSCRMVISGRGRARQMNSACQQARGHWLVFLHADSQLPSNWQTQLKQSGQWGFFPVKLSGQNRLLDLVAGCINLRSRLSEVATGDQGLYFRKSFFDELGGYPDIPIMEDVAICKLARRVSKPSVASQPVLTSSRRWQQKGVVKTVLLMWGLRLAYFFGINPNRLHRIYYPG